LHTYPIDNGPKGSFAEYLVAPTHMLIRLPEDFAFENAAQFGVSTFTTAQMFWESQKLARINLDGPPSEFESITLLIWGGASATGHYAIQYAKLAGYKIIVTASPKHFDRIRALGADVLFDYNDPEVVKKIREATGNKLKYAADCISEEYTLEKVSEALGEEGGVISCILPCKNELRKGVTAVFSVAYNLLGDVSGFLVTWTRYQYSMFTAVQAPRARKPDAKGQGIWQMGRRSDFAAFGYGKDCPSPR
jgi:NADPH:quinone reductase-like Zn-dependent oxidoreductase